MTFNRGNKYGAKRTMGYDSKVEADRGAQLDLLQRAGEITDLQRQQCVQLSEAQVHWRLDFCYVEDGATIYEEVKGIETEAYRLKRALWRVYGPATLRVMKRGNGGRIVMTEEIKPTGGE